MGTLGDRDPAEGEVKEMDVRPRQNAQGGGLAVEEGSKCRTLQRCKVNAQDADGLGADTGREEEQHLVLAPVI